MSSGQLAAQDALENAVDRSAALMETLAVLVSTTDKSEEPQLGDRTINGLKFLAMEQGRLLREAFDRFIAHKTPPAIQEVIGGAKT